MPYTDQFERADPLTLNPIGIFDLWPRQAVFEARALLPEGRSVEDLQQIAGDVEALICNEVRRLERVSASIPVSQVQGNPKTWLWCADVDPYKGQRLREHHGDTNLYQAALVAGRLPVSHVPFEDWEGYAVIALWKLVEFRETILAPSRRLRAACAPYEPTTRVPLQESLDASRAAAPLVIEAVRACALGCESRLRAEQMAALTTRAQRNKALAIERADLERRLAKSAQAREAAAATHQRLPEHQEKAWALANSKPFPSRAAAARYAAARIAKSDGSTDPASDDDCYTEKTVDAWLKARGWRRKPMHPPE